MRAPPSLAALYSAAAALLLFAVVSASTTTFAVLDPVRRRSTAFIDVGARTTAVPPPPVSSAVPPLPLAASAEDDDGGAGKGGGGVEEYRNAVTEVLSNFMRKTDMERGVTDAEDPLGGIDFDSPKFGGRVPLETLARVLDAELYEKEWFVTGKVNPIYFSDDFVFQDPDVKLSGIEEYARGVLKLFDQETSRAEIISTVVNDTVPNTITCTWRLSGKVNIGPGLNIKPYICYTDFTVDVDTGLIAFQEDRFDVPGWDILLSSVFPFLVGNVLAPAAPPVEPRVVTVPDVGRAGGGGTASASPLGRLLSMFGR